MNQAATFDLSSVPRALQAAGLYSSVCTIKQFSGTLDTLGQPDMSTTTPVAGLTSLPCMFGVYAPRKPDEAGTKRMDDSFQYEGMFQVIFPQVYTIDKTQQIANIDGTDYEIMAVEDDSQKTFTRLAVRIFTI